MTSIELFYSIYVLRWRNFFNQTFILQVSLFCNWTIKIAASSIFAHYVVLGMVWFVPLVLHKQVACHQMWQSSLVWGQANLKMTIIVNTIIVEHFNWITSNMKKKSKKNWNDILVVLWTNEILTGFHSCKYGRYIFPLWSTNIETLICMSDVGWTYASGALYGWVSINQIQIGIW